LRPTHLPRQIPFCACGIPAWAHKVDHAPRGNPCDCGASPANHRTRSPAQRRRDKIRSASGYDYQWVGIDGEGIGRNPHRYVMLCAADDNHEWFTQNPNGLSTEQCLEFLLMRHRCRLFAYSFTYDLTMILRDIPDAKLYKLFRPALRMRKKNKERGPKAVVWNGYKLNLLNTKFTVERGPRRTVIWDIFKFFQTAFVKALEKWQVGKPESIEAMKARRHEFSADMYDDIQRYCFDECRYLGELAHKLIDAHERADMKLSTYYGPGSSAATALRSMGIREKRGSVPENMRRAVACAFFGGRFEHSVIGLIDGPIYGYDISSAYPYQLYRLPCLEHGQWQWTASQSTADKARSALVWYEADTRAGKRSWTYLPFREETGSITFPVGRFSGWAWWPEWQRAREQSGYRFKGAWVLRSACNCRPFEKVAEYYRRRVELGKDSAGIALKLSINSIYGKLAQSTGLNPAFQCWVWAGLVTSGTRAQILDLLEMHDRPANALAIATDGIYSREKLDCPRPLDTGTSDLDRPLGGWECKESGPMFFVKPGIYFGQREEDNEYLRGRGIGRAALLENRERIIRAYEQGKQYITLPPRPRFFGAKSSISRTLKRSTRFADWAEVGVVMHFDTLPKRTSIRKDGTLTLRHITGDSAPYRKGMLTPEMKELKESELIEREQP
jgi:hypothetical protein